MLGKMESKRKRGPEDEMGGHELEQTPGDSGGQRSLARCGPWGRQELDTTERLNNKIWAGEITPPFLDPGLGHMSSACVQVAC